MQPQPSRRELLTLLGAGALAAAFPAQASAEPALASPSWGGPGSIVTYPQKQPLILVTDRPVQLETPRTYFSTPITSNAAFYVRWHLDGHPQAVDLATYRLRVEGAVGNTLNLSYAQLLQHFTPVTLNAVNQCSGNSRSFLTPRVPGSQWGHGAMGGARFTGVRLRDLLDACAPKTGVVQVQFTGMERGRGPETHGAYQFAKSLAWDNPVLDACVLAYAMNGMPLPLLNGFPLRLVVPGFYATYWVKCVGTIRLLSEPDQNYWTKKAYLLPDTPRGHISVEDAARGDYKKVPIGRMPARAFIITPDGSSKIPVGFPVRVQGLACSGFSGISKVEISDDDGKTWSAAALEPAESIYAYYPWSFTWRPQTAGRCTLMVRATDGKGARQSDAPFWNPSGYAYSRYDRQELVIGLA